MMKMWHDDVRYPPDNGWTWVQTNKEAVRFLLEADRQGIPVTEASFDHDLGEQPGNIRAMGTSPDGDGTNLAMALYHLKIVPPKCIIHSWNRDGAERMASIFEAVGAEVIVKPYEIRPNMCLLCGRDKEVCGDCIAKRDE